jgi:hypothetical protein
MSAGNIVIVLETGVNALPQASVAVQVWVTMPPVQVLGIAEKVESAEVPVIKQLPTTPFEKVNAEAAGSPPQLTVILTGAVIVGIGAGATVIVLLTGANALPQKSVAVQVSVVTPPQAVNTGEKVDNAEVPKIPQAPTALFVKGNVEGAGIAPQATARLPCRGMTGSGAGDTVMVLETAANTLPQASVPFHVSIMVPPHAGGTDEKVEGSELLERPQPPPNPLVKGTIVGTNAAPQAIVAFASGANVGNAGSATVTVLLTGAKTLPQASDAVQVSV